MDHVESFHACFDQVAREGRYMARLEAPPLDNLARYVARMIEDDYPFFVAADEADEVAGWCDIHPDEPPVHAHVGILGMALRPGWRGRRIGHALMEATLDHAKARGLKRVELTVYAGNTRAIRLYERFGFVTEGTKRQSALIEDAYVDVLLMARLDATFAGQAAA